MLHTTKKDGKTIHHPIGEELFITGNDQMIYYPRPEHAMIQYDGRYMHHAIAIPEGEGRYILNRLTGEITTVRGPQMYLPDPRTEVVVKRKLTAKECELMYPGNMEVLKYNNGLTEQAVEKLSHKGLTTSSAITDMLNTAYSTANQESTLAIFEANANISRGVSYTKPRTITLDTKYEGVVALDVWTGYAVNIVSKAGHREVVIGPTTRLLDYDETVEAIELSGGTPKSSKPAFQTAFLQIENNRVTDIINAVTADSVAVSVKLNYCVSFLEDSKDSWFTINNYVKYLCDNMRTLVKREIRKYNIKDFYSNSTEIIRNIVLDITEDTNKPGRVFTDNGMIVNDVDILDISVDQIIAKTLDFYQNELVRKEIELSDADARVKATTALAEKEKEEAAIRNESALFELELEQARLERKLQNEEDIRTKQREAEMAEAQAQNDLQVLLTANQTAEMNRLKEKREAEIEHEKALAEIEKSKQEAYANTVKEIMASISPGLIAAISASTQAELLKEGMESISPYALANGESVADTVNKLLRGTSLENIINTKMG